MVDLRQKLGGRNVGLLHDVLNPLIEFLDLRRRTQIDRIVGVDLLDRLDFLVRLFSAFKHLGERQMVWHNIFVQVDIMDHIVLQQLRNDLVALVVRNHDL